MQIILAFDKSRSRLFISCQLPMSLILLSTHTNSSRVSRLGMRLVRHMTVSNLLCLYCVGCNVNWILSSFQHAAEISVEINSESRIQLSGAMSAVNSIFVIRN